MNTRGREHGQVPTGDIHGNMYKDVSVLGLLTVTVVLSRSGTNCEGSQTDPGETTSIAVHADQIIAAPVHLSVVIGRLRVIFSCG